MIRVYANTLGSAAFIIVCLWIVYAALWCVFGGGQ